MTDILDLVTDPPSDSEEEEQEEEQKYTTVNEPPKQITTITPEEQRRLNQEFSVEMKETIMLGSLRMLSAILPKYIKLDVDTATQELSNSRYLNQYFKTSFLSVAGYIPEPVKAGVVTITHIAANCEYDPNDSDDEQPKISDFIGESTIEEINE